MGGLALLLGAVVALVVAFYPRGEAAELPQPIEAIYPLPGDIVIRQTAIEVDFPVGYTVELYVDGRLVPPFEIGVTEATGRRIWQPAPGRSMEQWVAGTHSVRVEWERLVGDPDVGSFEWTFEVR